MVACHIEEYLQVSEVIDWKQPAILELAEKVASRHQTSAANTSWSVNTAKACFEWVRDEIHHSYDYQMNPVTCRASDVLQSKTGYCYAKSHLLAALLRANGIPAGFCYQRLSIDDKGAPYSLHGFNAVYLPEVGWYRVDARGNRPGVDAQFTPPQERLAFQIQLPQEADFAVIHAEPLQVVVEALQAQNTWDGMLVNLPDVVPESWKQHKLISKVTDYEIRALANEDDSIVWKMLMYAAHEPSLESVQKQPFLCRYAVNWGRIGDMGFVASVNEQPIGAAWIRLYLADDRGFGYIADSIPELTIAVLPEHRSQGIGTKLLQQVLESAQSVYPVVSLNVRATNPAVDLYQRAGFVKVEGSKVVNRTGGVSFNMVCKFGR